MPIPIIFIHKDIHKRDNSYLNFSLHQAHILNENNPIFLITDSFKKKKSFVNYINLHEYDEYANEFGKLYKHLSGNDFTHELFCFQRWFIIKKFIEQNDINDFLYLDSDILLFCNVETEFKKYSDFDFTICNKIGPQYSYFSSKEKLFKFCEFVEQLYTNQTYFKRLENKYAITAANKLNGGVCDMTAFYEYQYYHLGKVKDLSVIENNAVFDDNINVSDGFEMNSLSIKNVVIKNREAFVKQISSGKLIRFKALHFQGGGKKYMYKFYLGNNLILQRFIAWLKVIKYTIHK